MFKFNLSNHNLLDVAGACLNMAARIRERNPGDAEMLARADRLEATARAVTAAFGGIDTKPATAEIIEKDQRRDDEFRALVRILEVHMLSSLHTATAPAATELYRILTGDGLDFLSGPYALESARLVELLDRLEAKADQLAAVGLTPYVAQVRAAEAAFVAARDARGQLQEGRPELVVSVRSPLSAAIRSVILLLSEPGREEQAAYVLAPLSALRPKSQPAAPADPAVPADPAAPTPAV
ncbi:hypothetical protein KKC22_03970 [Myxococcota bacterium]|nr:hypothetical protein [Myxococcota bacterium]